MDTNMIFIGTIMCNPILNEGMLQLASSRVVSSHEDLKLLGAAFNQQLKHNIPCPALLHQY